MVELTIFCKNKSARKRIQDYINDNLFINSMPRVNSFYLGTNCMFSKKQCLEINGLSLDKAAFIIEKISKRYPKGYLAGQIKDVPMRATEEK